MYKCKNVITIDSTWHTNCYLKIIDIIILYNIFFAKYPEEIKSMRSVTSIVVTWFNTLASTIMSLSKALSRTLILFEYSYRGNVCDKTANQKIKVLYTELV